MTSHLPSYHGYRFPPDIISHAVWLYHRFGLSFRDVEDLLAQGGRWCADSARWASSGRHVDHRDRQRVMISM